MSVYTCNQTEINEMCKDPNSADSKVIRFHFIHQEPLNETIPTQADRRPTHVTTLWMIDELVNKDHLPQIDTPIVLNI